MCLPAYWQWRVANERGSISVVNVKSEMIENKRKTDCKCKILKFHYHGAYAIAIHSVTEGACHDCHVLITYSIFFYFRYVKFHLAFYNENNVLVTHPLFTARNYLRLLHREPSHPFRIWIKNQPTLSRVFCVLWRPFWIFNTCAERAVC